MLRDSLWFNHYDISILLFIFCFLLITHIIPSGTDFWYDKYITKSFPSLKTFPPLKTWEILLFEKDFIYLPTGFYENILTCIKNLDTYNMLSVKNTSINWLYQIDAYKSTLKYNIKAFIEHSENLSEGCIKFFDDKTFDIEPIRWDKNWLKTNSFIYTPFFPKEDLNHILKINDHINFYSYTFHDLRMLALLGKEITINDYLTNLLSLSYIKNITWYHNFFPLGTYNLELNANEIIWQNFIYLEKNISNPNISDVSMIYSIPYSSDILCLLKPNPHPLIPYDLLKIFTIKPTETIAYTLGDNVPDQIYLDLVNNPQFKQTWYRWSRALIINFHAIVKTTIIQYWKDFCWIFEARD